MARSGSVELPVAISTIRMARRKIRLGLIGRLALAVMIAVGGLLLWNLPTVISLSTPFVVSLVPALEPQPAYGADSVFTYSRLGISAPISDQPDSSPLITSDWTAISKALHQGVALSYEGSSFTTAPLAFLTGHSSDYYPHPFSSVFAGLGAAKVGDTYVLDISGTSYSYTVMEKKVLNPADPAEFTALAPAPGQPQRVILITCWPVFTTTSRLAVVGVRS